jgi:hypothetical protein
MLCVGFETTIFVSKQAKTVHALGRLATVTGGYIYKQPSHKLVIKAYSYVLFFLTTSFDRMWSSSGDDPRQLLYRAREQYKVALSRTAVATQTFV